MTTARSREDRLEEVGRARWPMDALGAAYPCWSVIKARGILLGGFGASVEEGSEAYVSGKRGNFGGVAQTLPECPLKREALHLPAHGLEP